MASPGKAPCSTRSRGKGSSDQQRPFSPRLTSPSPRSAPLPTKTVRQSPASEVTRLDSTNVRIAATSGKDGGELQCFHNQGSSSPVQRAVWLGEANFPGPPNSQGMFGSEGLPNASRAAKAVTDVPALLLAWAGYDDLTQMEVPLGTVRTVQLSHLLHWGSFLGGAQELEIPPFLPFMLVLVG